MIRHTILLSLMVCAVMCADAVNHDEFRNPPSEYRPVPLWFWNNTTIEPDSAVAQIESFTGPDGYGGCAILPFGANFRPGYLTDEYFDVYGRIIDYASQHGLTMSLYDEYGFPSGSMGAINGDGIPRFKQKHPGKTIKRLDKLEYDVVAGKECVIELPAEGKVMSVAAIDTARHMVIPLSANVDNGRLRLTPPAGGNWRVMCCVCVVDGDPNVDYLDPEAVRLFVEDTHGQYFRRFPEAFGTVIKETFCDEPTMYRAQGRIWTDSFNERFQKEYGFSPEALYPALWYDIGPGTAAARNYLFGLRARLYAEGFMKTIQEWAAQHGIVSTGHQDQEEVLNPVSVSGDLMLCGKYMDVPGIDKIGGDRPAELFYKVVSSSAANWDKQLVMSETFGAMGNIPVSELYNIAMDQYTKGINQLIPHAVWYNDSDVTFLPELSGRNPIYREALPDFNLFLARLNYLLRRPGRTVADIAMLYPINSLQAGHYLDGPEGFYAGGVRIPGTDYINVASILTDSICRDFTFLHPEVLGNCTVGRGLLNMNNKVNHQHYKVLIVPGMKCIMPESLRMIEKFHKAGGYVIFTTSLPEQSATFQTSDSEIKECVAGLLSAKKNPAIFISEPTPVNIGEALAACSFVPDVAARGANGLRYIHRVCGDRHIYYFANPGTKTISAELNLRDRIVLRAYDPHTGHIASEPTAKGTPFNLMFAPGKSIFLISE